MLCILKEQSNEISTMVEKLNKTIEEDTDYIYGYEGDKKTILKPAQKNSMKLASSAQSCLFQLVQQVDTFRDQIVERQKKRDQINTQELMGIIGAFLSSAKAIKSRDEFKQILGFKG